MNRYTISSLIALLLLVAVLPFYATREQQRVATAQKELRQTYVAEATDIYLQNCARCHGLAGEGNGVIPPLNAPGMAEAGAEYLYKAIAFPAHGSSMAVWHAGEGIELSEYQVTELVVFVQDVNWQMVAETADSLGLTIPTLLTTATDGTFVESVAADDPHQCAGCHEEPAIHATRFGLDCVRCHSSQAWVPAQLTRHVFLLDHGSDIHNACQTCHVQTYATYDCFQCHDHDADAVWVSHEDMDFTSTAYEDCIACHPTGVTGEADEIVNGRSPVNSIRDVAEQRP